MQRSVDSITCSTRASFLTTSRVVLGSVTAKELWRDVLYSLNVAQLSQDGKNRAYFSSHKSKHCCCRLFLLSTAQNVSQSSQWANRRGTAHTTCSNSSPVLQSMDAGSFWGPVIFAAGFSQPSPSGPDLNSFFFPFCCITNRGYSLNPYFLVPVDSGVSHHIPIHFHSYFIHAHLQSYHVMLILIFATNSYRLSLLLEKLIVHLLTSVPIIKMTILQ